MMGTALDLVRAFHAVGDRLQPTLQIRGPPLLRTHTRYDLCFVRVPVLWSDPMRRQIVPWFGSKAALGGQIVPELGPHKSYFEPFCGGLGVLLQKPTCRSETVNDRHEDLTNLARILADADQSAELQAALDRRLCCEQLDREARERLKQPFAPTLARAVDFFYVSWMATSGVIGSLGCVSMAHGYGASSHSCASKLRNAADSIAAWHQRLRGVTITNRDGFRLLEQIHDEPGIVVYCDPPYVTKNATYCHDFAAEHHEQLARAVSRFQQTRVIVSYTEHPLLDRLYAGWTKKRLNYQARANRHAKNPQPKPAEILLINGPTLAPTTAA